MGMQERFIVPGLGVIVLLSLIALGARNVSLIYLLVMGVLGIAAIGTYFLPHAIQIETRIAIAALGLLTMFTYFSSTGFWLALLAFGAIGALQIRYRDELQTPLHTVAWLNEALARRGAGGEGTAQADDGDGGGGTTLPISLPAALQSKVRIDVVGIGA